MENPHGVCRGVVSAELDGEMLSGDDHTVPLVDDGITHSVRIVLG